MYCEYICHVQIVHVSIIKVYMVLIHNYHGQMNHPYTGFLIHEIVFPREIHPHTELHLMYAHTWHPRVLIRCCWTTQAVTE